MQMSSDLLTKHEITSWAALHLSVFKLSSREDFRAAKGMKCQTAWGLLSAGQPGPCQRLPVVQPRAVSGGYILTHV